MIGVHGAPTSPASIERGARESGHGGPATSYGAGAHARAYAGATAPAAAGTAPDRDGGAAEALERPDRGREAAIR